MAERVGFEPTVRCNRTLDFESSPIDHSGTSPPANLAARTVSGNSIREIAVEAAPAKASLGYFCGKPY